MGLIDFVKGAWDEAKNIVSDVKDYFEVPIRQIQNSGITLPIGDKGMQILKGNEESLSEVINTQNIPAEQINTKYIGGLESIFSDNKITNEERKYVATLPEAYQNIFKASKNIDQLKSYMYTDNFLKAAPEEATKMKDTYKASLDGLNYNIKRLEELDPGHFTKEEADKTFIVNQINSFAPKMKEIENIFGTNTDVANAYNKTVYDAAQDVNDLMSQAREGGLQDDKEIIAKIEDLKKMKQQRQDGIYLKAKNNSTQIKNWNDLFDLVSDDDSMKILSKNIVDTEEDIRQNLMKKSVAKTYEENKPILGTYKGAEYLLSYITRGIDEVAQNVATTKATDLSDIQYLSDTDGVVKRTVGKLSNWAIRNGGELIPLLIPIGTLVKGAQLGVKGAMNVGKIAKVVDGAVEATKVLETISYMNKPFNLIKGTVGIDSMFDYNLSAGMSDVNTQGNILLNAVGELWGAGLKLASDAKIAKKIKLNEADFEKAYDGAYFDIAIDKEDPTKTIKANIYDLMGVDKSKGNLANDMFKAIGDGAKIDLDTFKTSLNNAIDEFSRGLVAGEKNVDSSVKTFMREFTKKSNDALLKSGKIDAGEAVRVMNGVEKLFSNPEKLIDALGEVKKIFNDAIKFEANAITQSVDQGSKIFTEMGAMPIEHVENIINTKENLLKGISDYFLGKNVSAPIQKDIKKIVGRINETGKISDGDVMGMVRAFNDSFKEGKAVDYFKELNNFSAKVLGYVPEGLKASDGIKKLGELAETKFLDNVKAAKINVKFDTLKSGIGGTFKDSSAIISLYKDFYRDPDNFVIGFVHELTHGLINKNSELYTEMSVKYSEAVSTVNEKFAQLYDGFDIKNIDVKKLEEKGFTADEIEYIKSYGYRYKNTDEFIAYNLSESLVGKAPSDAFEILKSKVKAVADVAFDGKVTDDMFKVAGEKLMTQRFKVSSAKKTIATDIDNFTYSAVGAKKFATDINSFCKSAMEIGSVQRLKEILASSDADQLLNVLKESDTQLYNIAKVAFETENPLIEEFIRQSVGNGLVSGNVGYDAIASGGLFEIFGDFQTYVKYADNLETPEKMLEYFEKQQGQVASMITKIDFMLNNIPHKGAKGTRVQKVLTDIKALAQYYSYVDTLWKIGNRQEFEGLRRVIMTKIENVTSFGGVQLKNIYGMKKGTKSTEVLARGISDIVKDLQAEIGTKGVELNDYLLRSLTKASLVNEKIATIGFGVWKEISNALGLKMSKKTMSPQDVLTMLADAHYIKGEKAAGSLYGLGRVFGFDDEILKGNYNTKQVAIEKIMGGLDVSEVASQSAKTINTTTDDVLNFLNMKDFDLTDTNIGKIFDVIYDKFDIVIADKIANRVSEILSIERNPDAVISARGIAKDLAQYNIENFDKNVARLEGSLMYPMKKDIGELVDLARFDISFNPDGKVGYVVAQDGATYREIGDNFVSNELNSQAIGEGDYLKGVNSSSLIYENESKIIYDTVGTTRTLEGAKKVTEFLNGMLWGTKLKKSGITSLGVTIKDLSNLDDFPKDIKELNEYSAKYTDLYNKCVDNFGETDEVTKFVKIKNAIIKQHVAFRKTTDDVQYFKALSDVGNRTYTMIQSDIAKLDEIVADTKLTNEQKTIEAKKISDSVREKFTRAVDKDDAGKIIKYNENTNKEIIYIMPGSSQPRGFAPQKFTTVAEISAFSRALASSAKDMSMDVLENSTKYSARLAEGNYMLKEMKNFAVNGIGTKTFAFDKVKNLSSYGKQPFQQNVVDMVWKQFTRAKENFSGLTSGTVSIEAGIVDKIKDSVATIVGGRLGVDKSVVKDSIKIDYVKPTVVQVSYIDVDGTLRSYYMDTKTIDDATKFYQFALTRDEILEGKQVTFRVGGVGDDSATHIVDIDGSKYNGILENQVTNSIDMMEGDALLPIWEQAAKKALGSEYVKNIMQDRNVPQIFSFLMENKAVLKESSYETYKVVSDYDKIMTNSGPLISSMMNNIEKEADELRRFGEVYRANYEYVKALVLGKDFIPSKGMKIRGVWTDDINEMKKAFDSGTYTLKDFAFENNKGIEDVDKLNTAMKYNKTKMKDFGEYASVKYLLDTKYGPNLLMDYKGASSEAVDVVLDFYAQSFQQIYRDGMGVMIDKEVILKKIVDYMLNKKSLNISGFNNDIRGSFMVFESITKDLKATKAYNGIESIYDSMAKGTLGDSQRERIYQDLMGNSLWGKSAFMRFMSVARSETYALQLGWWSPKAYMIGAQNIVSNAVEVFSKRKSLAGTADEILDLNRRLVKNKYFQDVMQQSYGSEGELIIGLDVASAAKGKNLDAGGLSMIENGINKGIDIMYGLQKKAVEKLGVGGTVNDLMKDALEKYASKESIKNVIASGPIGRSDAIMKGDITNSFVYDKIFTDLETSPKQISAMVDRIEEIDKSLEGLKGLEREVLNNEKNSLIGNVNSIMKYASNEALFEYQQIYKAGTMAGLMRNGFSRRTAMTFFSSWGSKKLGEYLYNSIHKPFVSAHLAYKRGGMGAVGKTLANELLTNTHWNALVKQSIFSLRSMYQLNKDSELDTIGETDMLTRFMTVSPLGQAMKSFFLTRAGMEGFEQYNAARDEGLGTYESIKYGLSNAMYQASSQVFKELKFLTAPIALMLNESETKGAEGNIWNSVVDKVANTFMTSMYYSMYDMYKGIPSERLDGDTMYPFLDAVMGDTVTKYRYDMDKMMNAVFIEDKIEDGTIKVDWVGQLTSGLFGMPKTYNKRFALDQMDTIRREDKIYKAIAGGDLKSVISDKQFPVEIKSSLMKKFMEQNMIGEFDSGSDKGGVDGKVALILNELKSNGVDVQDLTAIMSSGNLKAAQKEMAILAASGMTKAESTTILAFMANKAYKEISAQYTKMKVPLSKNPQIKEDLYRQLFDVVMPTAMEIDKQVGTQVLFGYIQSAYGGKIPGLKQLELNEEGGVKAGGGTDPDTIKMFKLGLLADVADSESVAFNRDLLTNAGQRILQDTPDELVARKTAEMFQFVEELKTVSGNGKMVAKAAMLYGNLDRMKLLLNSKYAPAMQDEMNTLADIIWDTNEKLQVTPELLDALTYGGGSGTGGKKIKKPKNIEFQKDVVSKVNELAEAMPAKLKTFAFSLKSQRIKAKLQALSLPTLKQEKYDTYTDSKLTPIGGGADLKTGGLKVGEGKSKKSSPKIKSPKPGKSGSVSNSGIKRPTPIKIQRVKKAE